MRSKDIQYLIQQLYSQPFSLIKYVHADLEGWRYKKEGGKSSIDEGWQWVVGGRGGERRGVVNTSNCSL